MRLHSNFIFFVITLLLIDSGSSKLLRADTAVTPHPYVILKDYMDNTILETDSKITFNPSSSDNKRIINCRGLFTFKAPK